MSFPTKLLSTSPALQRDYGLIRSQIASSSQQRPSGFDLVSEDAEEDEQDAQGEFGRSMSSDTDNLSELSLPDDAPPPGRRRNASRSSRTTSRSTSTSNLHSVVVDHSRGIRSPNLHGVSSHASPQQIRRPSQAQGENLGGISQIAGIPSSYILGGQHLMPPADADMRSQEEIFNEETGDSEDGLSDAEPTPQAKMRTGWLSPEGRTPRPQHNRNEYVQQHTAATETSPLLRRPSDQSPITEYSQPQKTSGRVGGASGWDLMQPGPPGQEELDKIAAEPTTENPAAREVKVLIQYLIPTWGTHILELSLNIVSVFSLGHMGVNELAASSLSSMTANVTGYSIIAGFISALDSLLPSAYTSQPKAVGLITQRMTVIVAMMLPPIIAIWACSEQILLLLGQDPIVAALAGTYLRILAIGLPGYAGFEICRRYLQAQGLFHAPTVVLLFVSPLNALLNWLLVWGPDSVRIGFIGAPIASVISAWLMCLLCFTQCYIAPRIAWDGFTRHAFSGLKPIATLGMHGTFAMVSEWWSWEIVGLTTSLLGTTSLASQSVLLVSSSIVYQLPYALSVAAAVRVGNLLGAMQGKEAQICSQMALLLSLATGSLNSAFFLVFRKQWGGWFTQDAEVSRLIYEVMPILAAYQLADSITGVAGGILRGIGRQQAGAFVNVTAYYVVGIPIGLALTFSRLQWGLAGLWDGLTIALIYASIFSCLIIKRTNWDVEVQKSLERMNQQSNKPDDLEPAASHDPDANARPNASHT